MKRWVKWTIAIGGSLFAVVIAAVVAFFLFFEARQFKPQFEKQIAAVSGRPVSLGEDIQLSLFPWVGVSFSNLRVGNSPVFKESDFITIDSFEVRVKLLPLLMRKIQIKRFVVKSPRLVLITNKDGKTNWSGKGKEAAVTASEKKIWEGLDFQKIFWFKSLQADNLAINDGMVVWIDHARQKYRTITELNLDVKRVSPGKPIDIKFSCLLGKYPLTGKGTVGPLRKAVETKTLPVSLSLKVLNQVDIYLKGRIHELQSGPHCTLAVQVPPFSLRKLMAAFNLKPPLWAANPDSFKHLAVKADLDGNLKKINISSGIVEIDKSKLKFSLAVRHFTRPEINFEIEAGRIDLNRYLPSKASSKKRAKQDRFDFGPLRHLVVDGRIQGKALDIGKARIRNFQLGVSGKNGLFTLKLVKMDMFGGKGSGTCFIDLKKAKPFIKVDYRMSGVRSELAAKAFFNKDTVKGPLNIKANMTSRGMTSSDLTKNLSGTLSVKGRRITYSHLDLDRIIEEYEDTQNFGFLDIGSFLIMGPFGPLLTRAYENVDTAVAFRKGKSLIKILNSDWKISKGIATSRDVAFSTSKNRIAVKGNINLVTKRFHNLTAALIDKEGCIKYSQTINGPIHDPETIKASFVGKHIVGPFRQLFIKTKKFLLQNKCEVFYKGAVPHPVK